MRASAAVIGEFGCHCCGFKGSARKETRPAKKKKAPAPAAPARSSENQPPLNAASCRACGRAAGDLAASSSLKKPQLLGAACKEATRKASAAAASGAAAPAARA
eukprot:tig00000630_g2685.t1